MFSLRLACRSYTAGPERVPGVRIPHYPPHTYAATGARKSTEMKTLKDHVKAGECEFVKARAGNLWYRTALGLEFPVPMATMGEATFDARVPGMNLMGYIRKHLANIEAERSKEDYAVA